jgi:hypothetical protein
MFTRRALIEQMSLAAGAVLPASAMAQTTAPPPGRLAQDLPGISLPPGRHVVSSNLTVRADIFVQPGATIEVAAGKTLTLLGDFQAPIGPLFSGPGKVDLNRSRASAAYPEWWGAGRDNSTVDSLPALRACVAAHPVTLLGAADYFIGSTWRIDIPHRRIWGAGKYWHGPNQGTRIIVTNGRQDVIQIGFDAPPSGPNAFLQSVDIRWLEVGRSAAPADGGAAGICIRYVLNCIIEGISAAEHTVGFSIAGAVRSHIRDCQAFRSIPGGSRFVGFHLDGRGDIGLAGGNASIYLIDCNASIGGTPRLAESVGALLEGGFADSFLALFETSGVATGIKVDGLAPTINAHQAKAGHANLHLLMPVIDGFAGSGIEITNVSDHGMIDMVDPYVGAGAGAFAGIYLHNCKGMTTITGGQVIGWVDADTGGKALGIYGVDAEGIAVEGTKFLGFRRPFGFNRCHDLSLHPAINNPAQGALQGAVWLKDCRRGHIRPRIKGGRDAFPLGIHLRGSSAQLSIDCTSIDEACIQGGAINRFQADGTAPGVAPAGIMITGLDS